MADTISPPPGQIFLTPQGGGTPTNTGGGPTGLDPGIQSIINLITGGLGLSTANQDKIAGQTAAGMADPWASQRGPYQTALNSWMTNPSNSPMAALAPMLNLINNPSSLLTTPGYQFGMGQAMDAVNRGAGASGLLGSGNRLLALQDAGQRFAGSWFDRMFGADATAAGLGLTAQGQGFSQLAQLAGVNAGSPAAAGADYLTGIGAKNNALTGGVTGIATGLGGLLPLIAKALGIGGSSIGGFTDPTGTSLDQTLYGPDFNTLLQGIGNTGTGVDTGLGPDLAALLGMGP